VEHALSRGSSDRDPVDAALGGAAVAKPMPAPFARPGITRR
jgi:hypothetical protein